jgi:hypothetical protein
VADAILDRLVHNAHKIELKGESMRKKKKRRDERTNADEDEREEKKEKKRRPDPSDQGSDNANLGGKA